MTRLETAIHNIVLANRDNYMKMTKKLAEMFKDRPVSIRYKPWGAFDEEDDDNTELFGNFLNNSPEIISADSYKEALEYLVAAINADEIDDINNELIIVEDDDSEQEEIEDKIEEIGDDEWRKPNIDDYRQDDDFPHKYIKDLEIYENEKEPS